MFRVGVVGGLDPSGGAGIEMDVKVASAIGVHAHPIATMITYQTPSTYLGGRCLDIESIIYQLRSVKAEVWKTGALCSRDTVDVIIENVKGKIVVDPVMEASAGGKLFQGDVKDMLKLISHAYATTPNVPEAQRLLGIKIRDVNDMIKAAKEFRSLGPELVVITGGHMNELVDVILYKNEIEVIRGRAKGPSAHGSGSVLASALASYLAKGFEPRKAARVAVGFTRLLHSFKIKVDDGYVLDPFVQLRYMAVKSEMYEEYYAFIEWLRFLKYDDAKKIVPEVGINVAYSVPAEMSRGKGSILAVPGRMHLTPMGLKPCSYPWWGASDHMARLLLEAQKFNPKIRAAMNIKFTEENVEKLKRAGYRVVEVKREDQPKGIKTMEWSVRRAVELYGELPDVIYDRGFYGKEPMIRLLSESLPGLRAMVESVIK